MNGQQNNPHGESKESMPKSSQKSLHHGSPSKKSIQNGGGLSYNEWKRLKDAESRLKKKLIDQAQNEIKEELL